MPWVRKTRRNARNADGAEDPDEPEERFFGEALLDFFLVFGLSMDESFPNAESTEEVTMLAIFSSRSFSLAASSAYFFSRFRR